MQQGTVPKLVEKLKRKENTVNIILISGIPNSGKHKLAENLTSRLKNENLNTVIFKMPNVQQSISYDTGLFMEHLQEFH